MRRGTGNRGQAGQSLVELVVAIVLVSVVILTLLGGLLTLTAATGSNQRTGVIHAALIDYGEALRTQVPYVACPAVTPANYKSAADGRVAATVPAGMTFAVTSIDSWDPTTQTFTAGCSTDRGVQRIRFTASVEGDSQSAEVVKRREGRS
jgi:type II secretory pathway pseudopilin PulG